MPPFFNIRTYQRGGLRFVHIGRFGFVFWISKARGE